jgi:hypothetical protein
LLSTLLEKLHSKQNPFVIIELRPQDPLPEWITHVGLVEGRHFKTFLKEDYEQGKNHELSSKNESKALSSSSQVTGQELISLKGVRVGYAGKREVKVI